MVLRHCTQLVADDNSPVGFGCAFCGTHLCLETDIISKHFHGKHGSAFLVDRCDNYYFGPQEQKDLMTGTHIVRDVFCTFCDKNIGWSYDFANDEKERYKVHRFVLERLLIRAIHPGLTQGCLQVDSHLRVHRPSIVDGD